MPPRRTTRSKPVPKAESYAHHDADVAMRPDVGTQAQFRKKKAPRTYQYDSSLAPSLEWDGQNHGRERGEELIARIADRLENTRSRYRIMVESLIAEITPLLRESGQEALAEPIIRMLLARRDRAESNLVNAEDACRDLAALSRPFLNWAGKAERLSFDVPTLPLFVHDRLSTKAIIETLKSHRKDAGAEQTDMFDLFGDPQHSVHDQVLRAYEHRDKWTNRMVLGDSLVVMNSLLEYEGLGGQVQMIYMDPPYGVKFGSNFQPFVRKRDVSHGDDEDMSREPEMVKAYRDTWELGLHSYLTYLRDRLKIARELLTPSGSIFVQISDENLHHVREVMDEVFGAENCCGLIPFATTSLQTAEKLGSVCDYILWYGRDSALTKYRQLFTPKDPQATGGWGFNYIELMDGTRRPLTREERSGQTPLANGGRLYRLDNLLSQGATNSGSSSFTFEGRPYSPGSRSHWKTTLQGMEQLATRRRIQASTNSIQYVRFFEDFPVQPISNVWTDTTQAGFVDAKLYVVQTVAKVVERCILMTTDPGDLVLDPTCGSGTTSYVAEQWGRRWITTDVSRVPLALARQRLLTATFPWYELKDEGRGPGGGFMYLPEGKSRNPKSIGPGIVPHVTLGSIANNEPPKEEVLVDRPEEVSGVVRVTGPFTVEGTIPTPQDWEASAEEGAMAEPAEDHAVFTDRMIEVLRRSPVLHVPGGKTVSLKSIRLPARTLALSAEAMEVDGGEKPVALVFGPQDGAVSERLVHEALKEADLKNYQHLYVIAFAIQPNARALIEHAKDMFPLGATYVQATPDLLMGDLLKNMRSSQIFSVCGLPDIDLVKGADGRYQVILLGLDTFDPSTMETSKLAGEDVPAWFLDTDYNGLCFHVSQAFFPRTSAWESLKKALKATHEESVWDHLAGATSAPFDGGDHKMIAVKVIDDRGNELVVTRKLGEAKG